MHEENTIPVWSGCFAPFLLITFDEEDWSPSLEQINSATYDTTKLFRSSLNIDVNIAPLSLIVLFDGTLVLPVCHAIPTKAHALSVFNRHLTNILLGGMLVEEVAPDDVTHGSMNFWGYHRHNIVEGRYTKLSQSLRMGRGGPDESILLYHPKRIPKKQYLQQHQNGQLVAKHLPENLYTVLLPACTAFSNEMWERSLILGWTSFELMIEQLWKDKIIANAKVQGISSGRRKDFLNDSRTWTSSARIEMLWQNRIISDDLYTLADNARMARNAFAHSANKSSPEAAKFAINASLHLISIIVSEVGLNFDAGCLMRVLEESTHHFRSPISDKDGRLLVEPKLWRYPDPAPGFKDWGDRPFEKYPEIQFQPLQP